jgi:hypothetical protein
MTPQIVVTWIAVMDDRTCPICKALNGYQWTINTNEPFPLNLSHPQLGVVWAPEGSTTHKHRQNCRCTLHTVVEVADLKGKIQGILNLLAMSNFKYLEVAT